ncbi:MAG: MATE family efflux transporter, partial [Pseudomonadota bacterium]
IFALVLTPTYMMIITAGVLRASGRVRTAMFNALIAAAVNVVGDVVLAFGCGPIPALGFRGIAYGSAIAVTVGMVLNFLCVYEWTGFIGIRSITAPLTGCFRNLLRLGLPSALQQVAWNTGTLVVYFLVGRLGAGEITALAAMTGGLRVEAIIFLPIFAMNMAAAVLTGTRLGKGDVEGARFGAEATAGLSLAITLLPSLAIFALAPQIAASLTGDPAVLDEMVRYLRINMVAMPFLAVGVSLSGSLQGAGDTFATMRIIVTGMWLVRIPSILLSIYVFRLGPAGVWWCMTMSLVLLCILMAARFRGNRWTRASIDEKSKRGLWEACLPRSGGHGWYGK